MTIRSRNLPRTARVDQLELSAFRGLRHLAIDFDPSLTVLVGKNGCGKTSVLRGLALMLSQQQIAASDVQIGAEEARLTLRLRIEDERVTVERARTKRRVTRGRSKEDVLALGALIGRPADANASLPLCVYYPVDRALLSESRKVRKHEPHPAYAGALHQGEANFASLFDWFQEQEAIENKLRLVSTARRLPGLEAVRQAIKGLLPEVTEPQIVHEPLRMTVRKRGVELNVLQLSDGEKNLLAMAADLARRLAQANPGLHDPLQGSAVVLIDEIELHLYPGWQRDVVRAMQRTFPNCQLVMTTHSPQVLSWVKPEQIRLLGEEDGEISVQFVDSAYGRDANQILTDVMGVTERPKEIEDRLLALFRLIEDGELAAARAQRDKIAADIGPQDPELVRADAYLRHRESQAS